MIHSCLRFDEVQFVSHLCSRIRDELERVVVGPKRRGKRELRKAGSEIHFVDKQTVELTRKTTERIAQTRAKLKGLAGWCAFEAHVRAGEMGDWHLEAALGVLELDDVSCGEEFNACVQAIQVTFGRSTGSDPRSKALLRVGGAPEMASLFVMNMLLSLALVFIMPRGFIQALAVGSLPCQRAPPTTLEGSVPSSYLSPCGQPCNPCPVHALRLSCALIAE